MLSPSHVGVVKVGTWFHFVRQSAPSPIIWSDLVTQEMLGLINLNGKLAADAELLQCVII